MADSASSTGSFWTSLPGILTGIATLLGACTGLYLALAPKTTPTTINTPPHVPGPPSPHSPKATFRVVEAMLRGDPFNYSGKCPVAIKFSGRISTVGGSGIVSYKFLRSDGASAPVQSLTFNQPSSQEVFTTWFLSANYSGWEQIQIYTPTGMTSDRAVFSIRCQ
jgi:hypothetical protein